MEKQESQLATLAQDFSRHWNAWRFAPVHDMPEPLLEAANALVDFLLNYSYEEFDGHQVEVWRKADTSDWYIGTPRGSSVGPIESRELALEIAASYYSHGPAEKWVNPPAVYKAAEPCS